VEFTELKDLYSHLDARGVEYKRDYQIASLFQRLRDVKHEAGQTKEAEIAQWEVDCFSFRTQGGKLRSMFSGTNNKGQPVEYPAISKLSDSGLDHIEGRLKSTTNPILRARYAHILWESRRKHKKYAEIAVDAYLKLVESYEEQDKNAPEGHSGLYVLSSIEQAASLGFSVGYRVPDLCSGISRLVKEFNVQSSSAFVVRARLINYMLENKANFASDCFAGFPEVCLGLGQKFFEENRFHNSLDIFRAGERVDRKLGVKTHDWPRSIAESYEGLMNERAESDLAVMPFCQNAIEQYRKLGDDKKVEELEKRYEYLRGKQKFGKVSREIDLTEFRNQCRDVAQNLCAAEPDTIISTLIADKSLLPRRKDMEKNAEELNKTAVLTSIVPVAITDQHGHTAEHFVTEEEKLYFRTIEQYTFSIQLEKQFLIDEIFIGAIKKDRINISTVMHFLQKNSWYGKNITKRLPSGETITYNWLNLIAPGLNEYFVQIQWHLSQPAYVPSFVLAIDSLVLKIEGLVRDICVFSGVTTFYQAKDKQGRIVVREKDINWLLREEPIRSLFDEDDLLFFKFVLIEKAGLNLRHKIAHCLIYHPEYNISCMHLLLLVLLRLGRYDFVKSSGTVEERVEELQ
jgi:Domain of unknown function (DUF4209)